MRDFKRSMFKPSTYSRSSYTRQWHSFCGWKVIFSVIDPIIIEHDTFRSLLISSTYVAPSIFFSSTTYVETTASRSSLQPPHQPQFDLEPEEQQPPPEGQQLPPPKEEQQSQDYQCLLDNLLWLPGRNHLPMLSNHPIEGVETIWFNRDKGKLARVIGGIFGRKFDGPYYSWSVTPVNIQERYFRTFARKYNWDIGIMGLVKERYLKIAKKCMISQAKTSSEKPILTGDTLWKQMWVHWNTPDAIEKSETASQSRNSDHGGLGVHKHLFGQKSYLQVHQEMEEELGRPVSLGEVFMKTHTRSDGSFVDQKAKQVAEAYEKNLEEIMSQMDEDGPENSENSNETSTQLDLSIEQKNEIFLKCTQTDDTGNPFGLGQLGETMKKGKSCL